MRLRVGSRTPACARDGLTGCWCRDPRKQLGDLADEAASSVQRGDRRALSRGWSSSGAGGSSSLPRARGRRLMARCADTPPDAAFTRRSSAVDHSGGRRRRGMSALRRGGTPYRSVRWCRDGGKLGAAERTCPIGVGAAVSRRRRGIRPGHHRGSRCWSNRTGVCGFAARATWPEVDRDISGRLPRQP